MCRYLTLRNGIGMEVKRSRKFRKIKIKIYYLVNIDIATAKLRSETKQQKENVTNHADKCLDLDGAVGWFVCHPALERTFSNLV